MKSEVQGRRWATAKLLVQIQLLSCDHVELDAWQSPDFAAPFWRLYWHDKPGGVITVDGRDIPLDPAKLLLIPPNVRFGGRLEQPFGQMFIHFLTEPRHRVQAGVVYLQSLSRQTRVVCRRFISMVREDPLAPEVSLICQQLVAEALRKVPKGDWQPVYTDARITETVALIQASYPSRRSNRDLARSVGMHTNAFIRLFRSVTGCTPVDFLKNARLEEACVLLHQTDTSIEDIAEKTGFCDRGHFSRVFTQAIGYSPARYRSFVNVCGRVRR